MALRLHSGLISTDPSYLEPMLSSFIWINCESAASLIAMHPPQITTKILKNEARSNVSPIIATLGTVEWQSASSNCSHRCPIQSTVIHTYCTPVETESLNLGPPPGLVCSAHRSRN